MPIQARTQSIDSVALVYGLPIVYDITNTFAVLEFHAAPTSTLVVTYDVSTYTSVKNIVGSSYDISFIVTPTIAIAYASRIVFLINKDSRFKFVNSCKSEVFTDGFGVTFPALAASAYTCTVGKKEG